ncbi:hypothetical protein SDC9_202490 [bioreactor metagenome]|uniref:Uncharacterized protein n=1 Tax=bioreactor metagenome TaxID=1076179 RepID=A0A645J5S5_9ZZZZ
MEPSFSVSGIDRSDDGALRTMRNGTAGSVSWKTAFSVSEGAWPKATPEMREGRRLNRIDVGLGVFSVGIKGSRVLIAKEVG